MLENIITSKTRLRLLMKFFINSANNGHLRGLADEMNESTNAIRKELNNLSEAGYLEKHNEQNRISYRANSKHPLFDALQKIIRQHMGLDSLVSSILERMGNVRQIVLVGDYAKGIDSGIIEVVLVGQNLNMNYIDKLVVKIEKEIHRKVQFKAVEEFLEVGLVLYQE